ncbi:ABC-type bacteriocin/lantibiotic exporter with double-glycine peptidase domain [Paenibacillus sp. DS2015]|uniref:ABC transporter ATP-binding protein n=1 Tax=Paenibacillus sp. DS2015 TaxID=3373917 RepID=UPI003D1F709C
MDNIKFILKYLIKFKTLIVAIILLSLLSSGINLIMPYITKQVFDYGIVPGEITTIVNFCLLLIGLYFFKFIISYYSNILHTKSSVLFTMSIKKDLYSHLLRLPMSYFDKNKKGYILSRIDETDSLSILFSSAIIDFFASLITAIGALIFILNKSWILGVVSLVFLPLFYFLSRISLKRIHSSSKELYEVTATTKGKLQESIEGIQELKQLNNEQSTFEDLTKRINKITKETINRGKFAAIGTQGVSFLMNFSQILIILIIGILIVKKKLSIGDYMALTQYVLMLYAPVQLLSTFSMTIQPSIVALQRIVGIFKLDTEVNRSGHNINNIETIEFKNISFNYDGSKDQTLKNINFTLKKGDKVAFEGINGSGKSTIVKLLLGLYTNYEGEININGININKINIKTLRDRIGIVSQNIILFSGTLMDNIKMANPEITNAKLEELLKIFNDKIFDDIDPYSTTIGEKGNNLSGGQKQKIAVLRAIAKDPDVLIFDEATSNMDISSQSLLKDAINSIFKSKTCILISHEKHISNLADIILKVEDGVIEDQLKEPISQ